MLALAWRQASVWQKPMSRQHDTLRRPIDRIYGLSFYLGQVFLHIETRYLREYKQLSYTISIIPNFLYWRYFRNFCMAFAV